MNPEQLKSSTEIPVIPIKEAGEVENAKILERELSPEQIEIIMNKVQDINEPETCVHSIAQCSSKIDDLQERLNILEAELKSGILGTTKETQYKNDKEGWTKQARAGKLPITYFNIIGRDIDRVGQSHWVDSRHFRDIIAIIFNKEKLKELPGKRVVHAREIFESTTKKIRTFTANNPLRGIYIDGQEMEDRTYVPFSDDGYAAPFRIPPRFFTGIVIRPDKEVENSSGGYEEEKDETKKQVLVDEIVTKMRRALADRRRPFLPVYDIHGNLLWPKQMSYEEVKKFVVERDAENKNNKK